MAELTPDVVSTPSGIMKAQTDKLAMGAKKVWLRVFRVYESSHSGEVCRDVGKVLS